MEPRLKVSDLVKVRRAMTFRGKKIKTKENGIILDLKFINGLSVGQIYWQQSQTYSEEFPTEHLVKVEDEKPSGIDLSTIKEIKEEVKENT